MPRVKWNAYDELEGLHREIEKAFEGFGLGRWEWPFSQISFLPARSARAYPLLNISEDKDHVYVEGLAPGVNPESLSVTIANGQLTITGEKKGLPEEIRPEAYHRNERGAGRFIRTIALPSMVNEEKISADYRNGVIMLTIPKMEAAKPKQIQISIA
jgi:HSP20 family protein